MNRLLRGVAALFGRGAPQGRFIGTIGTREVFTLALVAKRQVQMTGTTVYEFRDASGSAVAWFSNDVALEIGQTYLIRATVHRHLRYQGVPTTYVTRGTVLVGWDRAPCTAAPGTSVNVTYSVVGASHSNADGSARQKIIQRCRVGDVVSLECESNGPDGTTAVAVVTRHGQIGYISSDDAGAVAGRLDRGQQAQCTISGIFRGTRGTRSRGVELGVRWPLARQVGHRHQAPDGAALTGLTFQGQVAVDG